MFRRFQAENAAEVSGDADRAAEIAADLKRHQPRRERRSRTAAGPSGGAIQLPWVVSSAKDGVTSLKITQQHGHVGLSNDYCPSSFETRSNRAVFGWDVV